MTTKLMKEMKNIDIPVFPTASSFLFEEVLDWEGDDISLFIMFIKKLKVTHLYHFKGFDENTLDDEAILFELNNRLHRFVPKEVREAKRKYKDQTDSNETSNLNSVLREELLKIPDLEDVQTNLDRRRNLMDISMDDDDFLTPEEERSIKQFLKRDIEEIVKEIAAPIKNITCLEDLPTYDHAVEDYLEKVGCSFILPKIKFNFYRVKNNSKIDSASSIIAEIENRLEYILDEKNQELQQALVNDDSFIEKLVGHFKSMKVPKAKKKHIQEYLKGEGIETKISDITLDSILSSVNLILTPKQGK
jgi:hypothetical protein